MKFDYLIIRKLNRDLRPRDIFQFYGFDNFSFFPWSVLTSMEVCLKHQHMDSGFGKDYVWYDWQSGLAAAKEQ